MSRCASLLFCSLLLFSTHAFANSPAPGPIAPCHDLTSGDVCNEAQNCTCGYAAHTECSQWDAQTDAEGQCLVCQYADGGDCEYSYYTENSGGCNAARTTAGTGALLLLMLFAGTLWQRKKLHAKSPAMRK